MPGPICMPVCASALLLSAEALRPRPWLSEALGDYQFLCGAAPFRDIIVSLSPEGMNRFGNNAIHHHSQSRS
jgi:hypothetical protein